MQRLLLMYMLLILAACLPLHGQSVIRLDLKGYTEDSYAFMSQTRFKDEVYTRQRGDKLRWKGKPLIIKLEEPEYPSQVNITFSAAGRSHYLPLILFPGDSLAVEIDVDDFIAETDFVYCQIAGPNAAGHQFLYTHAYYPPIYYMDEMSRILEESPKDQLFADLQREYARQLKPLDSLLAEGEIEETYYDLARGFVETPLISRSTTQLYGKAFDETDRLSGQDRREIVELIFAHYSPLDKNRLYSNQGHSYASNYYLFQRSKEINATHFFGMPDETINLDGKKYTLEDAFPSLYRIPDDRLRELLFAGTLYTYYQIMVADHGWLDEHTNFFYSLYPETRFREVIEWSRENSANVMHQRIMANRRPAAGAKTYVQPNKSDAWIPRILDDAWNLDLLSQGAQDQLGGKDLYVDIWATWCRPCLKEMEYNAQTDSLLAANDIERLYISIDKQEDEEVWFYKVFELQLGGYHVRAGQELDRQLGTELGYGNGPILIPRYLLIKDGQIIDKKAARPSEFRLLKRQVERYFSDQ